VVSLFGVLIRPRIALAILLVIATGIAVGVWAVDTGSPSSTHRGGRVIGIHNVQQGLSFTTGSDPLNKIATYTFDVENDNSFSIYVRHVEARVPGLKLLRTAEWSTARLDNPGSGISETITVRVASCGRVPRRSVPATLQVRTYSGTWQTLKIALMGDGSQEWQSAMVSDVCSTGSS
jgi:hypothetical protein